jgi:ABC-2 type transport system ATP-binding protein
LRDQGKALIVSSHILADMSEYCTHIGIMSAGQMVQYGTVAEVSGHATNGRCRYTIALAEPVAGLEGRLAMLDGVDAVHVDRDRVLLDYASDKHSAARLLAQLVEARVPVASFNAVAPGLEEAYLRTGIRQVD